MSGIFFEPGKLIGMTLSLSRTLVHVVIYSTINAQ